MSRIEPGEEDRKSSSEEGAGERSGRSPTSRGDRVPPARMIRSRVTEWWRGLRPAPKIWLAVALTLFALRRLLAVTESGCVAAVVALVWFAWLGLGAAVGLWWLWRRLTYRVSVRLVFTHLLAGAVPLAMTLAFLALVSYMFVGQYAAVRYGQLEERLLRHLGELAAKGLGGLESGGLAGAEELLSRAEDSPPEPATTLGWVVTTEAGEGIGSDEPLPGIPEGAPEGFRGVVIGDRGAYFGALDRGPSGAVLILTPVTQELGRRLSDGSVFEVRYTLADVEEGEGGVTVSVSSSGEDDTSKEARPELPEDWEEGWARILEEEGSLLERLHVLWFRVSEAPLGGAALSGAEDRRLFTVLKMPVAAVPTDLFRSVESQELLSELVGVLFVLFGVLSLLSLVLAATIIVAITRSTARLRRGARAVAAGELRHRIPVRRRDELGDLAVAFNTMAASVERMLSEVADKERMAREMELAREIQEGLLPRRSLEHGPFRVRSRFRPATEVGGDYFDLLPVQNDRLVVLVGDVGGHGLHTGLVMASLKSVVSTLVEEGVRSSEIAIRVNARLRRRGGQRRQMATLCLVELETGSERGALVSAGHPPAILVSPDGTSREIEVSALPLGHRWPEAPEERTFSMAPGSRMILYSDGLVEAADPGDGAFGYERLRAEIEAGRKLSADDLLDRLLGSVLDHVGERGLEDDLTILVVDRE